ncbi:hypothetical protein PFICI_10691 [Pestalotiopsis fici W106-1]|uniref:SnoaL-like domain-containing protein n=1 Tax=Pestalotiopsis fici (strain W106-1 / CGMCC3.15140) TaxID=1229662 RepID=W3WXV8_PESFW|nr:uncharacterized protein PFICI_10691 [Pestalotiopsis fici W106-1]ETS78629.1 hypothetical protein PFICI_10691 [Pestalotiopsis fici W106-1]
MTSLDHEAGNVAKSFISHLRSRNFSALELLFAPKATYWVSGDPSVIPWAGTLPISERAPQLPAMHNAFQKFQIDQRSLTAEKKRAVVEFGVYGQDKQGGEYANDVVMVFEIDENGKIISLREYLDSMRALTYIQAKRDA